jgi:hypothetical protein
MMALVDARRAACGVELAVEVLPIAPSTCRAHVARRGLHLGRDLGRLHRRAFALDASAGRDSDRLGLPGRASPTRQEAHELLEDGSVIGAG